MKSVKDMKAMRVWLGWTQGELAARSGVSEASIKRIEAGDDLSVLREATRVKLVSAFREAGVTYSEADGAAQLHKRSAGPSSA